MEANRRAKSGGKGGIFVVLAVLAVIFVAGGEAYCRTITVRADGSGDYPTIQAAIDDANEGDVVVLEPGTYRGDGNRDIDFLGKAITVQSENGPEDCIIDSNGTISERHRGFYFHRSEGPNSVLSGFTIRGGGVHATRPRGGGIYCSESSPKIENCIITDNKAEATSGKYKNAYGGGVYVGTDSHPVIKDCVIWGNRVRGHNAEYSYEGVEGGVAMGGGIFCGSTGSVYIENCLIFENEATGGDGSDTKLMASGAGGGAYGGGICIESWVLWANIRNCRITGNKVVGGAGGGCESCGARDGGDVYGAGLYVGGGSAWAKRVSVTNCTVTGNKCIGGAGGISQFGGDGDVGHVCGGGLNGGSKVSFQSGVIWENIGADEVYGSPVITYSCIEGSYVGTGNTGSNPCFFQAGFWDVNETWVGGDYRLWPESPCVDSGDPNYVGEPNETDLDGNPRVVGGRVDMGAYEFTGSGVPELVSLEITGPNNVSEHSSAQYTATAYYDNGYTRDVTKWANWSVEPETCGGFEGPGVLRTGRIETDEYITVYAQYTSLGVTVAADMGVRVAVLVGLEITGRELIPGNFEAQYGVIVHYDNGHTNDVTDGVVWGVEPETVASIDANGVVRTAEVDERQEITVYAEYTSGNVTVEGELGVEVYLHLYVPTDYETIQAAINAAEEMDTIIIAPGVYKGDGNRDIDYKGKAITVRGADPNDANVVASTVIDCEGDRHNPHRGFKFTSGEGADSVLAGVTIVSGYGPEEEIDVGGQPHKADVGGGIFCDGSSPTIAKCVIKGNMAERGGGIWCADSNATISDCIIEENLVDYSGGGIDCLGGNPTVSGCTLRGNLGPGITCGGGTIRNCVIEDNVGFMGAGINCGSATISDCTIRSNNAGGWGGGVYCRDATISNCIISNNSAEGEHGQGGGICCAYGSSPVITGCVVSGNRSSEEGGGICGDWGGTEPVISNCVIAGNVAGSGAHGGDGGGVANCDGPITNCVITGNITEEGDGGGLAYCNGPIVNCTIAGNRAELRYEGGRGGGVYGCGRMTNCIVWGNWPSKIHSSGPVRYSDVEGGWEGEGNMDAEPEFALEGDYHIMPGSACIDAGTNDPCGGLAGTDLEGVARPLDGDGDGNAVADMGAYEFDPNSPRIAVSGRSFYFVQDWPGHETQTLLIRNSGGAPLNWQVVEDCDWLEVVPGSGTSTGEIAELMLIVDANGLAPGVYEYTFTLWDPNSPESQISITVTLPVGWVLQVSSAEYPTIQAAISAASDYDVVVVADGNYTGEGNKNLDFGGKAIRVKSENGPNNCVIDCENSGRGFYFHNGEDEDSVVDGFTITKSGCGVWCREGSPTIRNCSVIENSGGGIVCSGASNPLVTGCVLIDNGEGGIIYDEFGWKAVYAVISNCRIVNNEGGGIGGIGSARRGMLTITDCTISGNDGPGISCARARIGNCTIEGNTRGGVNCGGDLKIDNCTVRGNTDWESLAAGIRCLGDAEITNCVISDNAAEYVAGVYCSGGWETRIENCIISNNRATKIVGGMGCYGPAGYGSLTISGCKITGNRANEMGGASLLSYENVEISNCLIAGNSAESGGGGMVLSGSDNVVVSNCTVSDNEVKSIGQYGAGGGISFYGGNVSVNSCIMWGNKGPEGPQMYLANNCYMLVSYSDVEGGEEDVYVSGSCTLEWGEGSMAVDPCFALAGDYHIMGNSPCVDGGDANYSGEAGEVDLDGNPRVLDGDGDGNETIDMGAYEYNPDIASIAVSPRSFWFIQDWPEREPQTLSIRNFGGQELNWEVVEDCNWLEVTPTSGVSIEEVDEVTIRVDPNGLAPGLYGYTFTVEDGDASNSSVEVRVEMGAGEVLWVPSEEFWTIQAAVDAANIYDVVVVQDGTYSGEGNRDIDFKGKAISVKSENGAETCIIDCNGTEDEPHRGFYFHNGEDGNSVLEGFTITGGFGPEGVGGAIVCKNSSPTIKGCIITGNIAQSRGGGVYCRDSGAKISSCTMTGNWTDFEGGGIYCEGGGPTVSGCTITDNRGGRLGGGIGSYQSEVRVADCTIGGNAAGGGGGAVYCRYGKLTISECILSMNRAGSIAGGGGIYCSRSEATIGKCTVSNNFSEGDGGGIVCWDSMMAVKNCVISGNIAEKAGGGCWDYRGNLTLSNCTVTGNVAKEEYGGGILSMRGESVITNCIVWGNESPNGPEIYLRNEGSVFVSYSDVEGGEGDVYVGTDANLFWEEGNIDMEPDFVEAGYWDANGTANDVNDDFWVEGDYHLQEGSPCIDAGTDAGVYEDIEGNERPIDYPDVDNNGEQPEFDMGAYEAEVPAIEVRMHFTPKTLNPKSKGKWMKAHMLLPEGFGVEDVDVNTPAVIEPVGIESEYIKAFVNDDGLVELEIGFSRRAFCEAGIDYGPAEIMVSGRLTSGQGFYGVDTIKILANKLRGLASFVSYWLEEGCGRPNWCAGADVDRDAMVDFEDFAQFDTCCIEVSKKE